MPDCTLGIFLYKKEGEMKRAWLSKHKQTGFFGASTPMDAITGSIESFYGSNTKHEDAGIQDAFLDAFPVASGTASLDFVQYRLGEPAVSEENAIRYDKTLTVPLHAVLRATYRNEEGISGIVEDEVLAGKLLLPRRDRKHLFVVNGKERTLVPQLQRSPGAVVETDGGGSRVVLMPKRGTWLVVGQQQEKGWFFSASRNGRKHPLPLLLLACGFTPSSLARSCSPASSVFGLSTTAGGATRLKGKDADGNEKEFHLRDMINKFLAKDHYLDGRPMGRTGDRIDYAFVLKCRKRGLRKVHAANSAMAKNRKKWLLTSLFSSFCAMSEAVDQKGAVAAVHGALARNTSEPDMEKAAMAFYNAFFNPRTCRLSPEGKRQATAALGLEEDEAPDEDSALTQDFLLSVVHAAARGNETDSYSLENRRLRMPGEMLEESLGTSLRHAAEAWLDKTREEEYDVDGRTSPKAAWSSRHVTKEMDRLAKSGLCQKVDDHNPLTRATQTMRFSSLGEGGIADGAGNPGSRMQLMKMRVPEEARWVHESHYGKLSPLGPEGANIGLVGPLALNAAVDGLGFLCFPAYRVAKGRRTRKIEWLSSHSDMKCVVAFGDERTRKDGRIKEAKVDARVRRSGGRHDLATVDRKSVTHIDASPAQFLSLESALVPFIAHNDATRAAIAGSQMRQAVPLVAPVAPMVGTGREDKAAEICSACARAVRSGTVAYVDSCRTVVLSDDGEADLYETPPSMEDAACGKWRPAASIGDRLRKGDCVMESSTSQNKELALGGNARVAFTTWFGYNFEDAIAVSERLVSSGMFTSLHAVDLVCRVKETPFGEEIVTDDLPDVAGSRMSHLDENGIVRIGSKLREGDIVVGKTTPKDPSLSTALSPEDKLIGAVTGYWAVPSRDTSLRVPAGCEGTVVSVDVVVSQEDSGDLPGTELRAVAAYGEGLDRNLELLRTCLARKLSRTVRGRLVSAVGGRRLSTPKKATRKMLERHLPWDLEVLDPEISARLEKAAAFLARKTMEAEKAKQERKEASEQGVDLDSNVLKEIRVRLACSKELQVGDKMAGRHGNKGVVSIVVPTEDMPYDMETGEPMDMLLNPLGVPSRMNVGQVLETHLGAAMEGISNRTRKLLDHPKEKKAARKLRKLLGALYDDMDMATDTELWEMAEEIAATGAKCAVPPMGRTSEKQVKELLGAAGLHPSGQRILVDGRTGRPFDRPVTTGIMYMMKLHHMADTKMHARSTGPYNRVTQQPTQGSSARGGQRMGEMEMWALMAYGASANLQEMLGVKSDNVAGRRELYDAILETGGSPKMADLENAGALPESAAVLFQELRALGLDVRTEKTEPEELAKLSKHELAERGLSFLFGEDEGPEDIEDEDDEEDDW